MGEESAFLRAIADAPADDAPRLVYADWLDDRGDPRGPFVRAQVALARLPAGHPDLARLARSQDDLFPSARAAYLRAVPSPVAPYFEAAWTADYRRGCLARVTVASDRVADFADRATALFRIAPVEEVGLVPAGVPSSGGDTPLVPTPTVAVERLLRVPELSRVGALSLTGPFADPDGVARLVADCPALGGLVRLEFGEEYAAGDPELRPGAGPAARAALTARFGGRVSWRAGEFAEPDIAPDPRRHTG